MKKNLLAIINRFIEYTRTRLTPHQFLVFSSVLVGVTSGLAAVALKYVVHAIEVWIQYDGKNSSLLFALLPGVGIALTFLYVRFMLHGRLKRGSAEIAFVVAKKSSVLPRSGMYSHLITSALTVAFGGSVGLESPMVSTGSAIGSNFGRVHHLSYKERTILLACGAAAGIAAAFNSPIAGVLFAIEVLLTDASAAIFIPLIIAAASGALVAKIILKEGIILSFTLHQPFDYHNIPWYVLLGVVAGLCSLYYARSFEWSDRALSKLSNPWKRIAAGAALLFFLILVFPPLYGEGYETIKMLSGLREGHLLEKSLLHGIFENEYLLILALGVLLFLKPVAAAITISSGGNGGSFGPSLFMGAYLGFVFARLINLTGVTYIPEVNFTLVAMAGILSGVFYAPLTAIFLIAEITGGYDLIIPLMLVSALSVTVARYFQPLSMEGKKLSALLRLSIEDRDKYLLSKMNLHELIETDFSAVHAEDTLQMLVKIIAKTKRNTFPVTDADNKLIGIIHLDQIREVMFQTDSYEKFKACDLMSPPAAVITPDENLHDVLKKFDHTGLWNLPVTEDGHYKGFVSKSSILTQYRNELMRSA